MTLTPSKARLAKAINSLWKLTPDQRKKIMQDEMTKRGLTKPPTPAQPENP